MFLLRKIRIKTLLLVAGLLLLVTAVVMTTLVSVAGNHGDDVRTAEDSDVTTSPGDVIMPSQTLSPVIYVVSDVIDSFCVMLEHSQSEDKGAMSPLPLVALKN